MTDEPIAPVPSDDSASERHRPDPLPHMAMGVAQLVTSRELIPDARTITRMGPGLYELDLVGVRLRHAMRYFPELYLASTLRFRLRAALADHEMTWEDLTRATVNLDVRLDERDPAKGYRPMMEFGKYTGPYVLCRMEVKVLLATASAEYPAQHRGQIDWPRDWSRTGL